MENITEIKKERNLGTAYDYLFASLESLQNCTPAGLESAIKRADAVRRTMHEVIDAAKLEFAYKKTVKASAMKGLFPKALDNVNERKQLGAGEK